jgi:hypothetical protein
MFCRSSLNQQVQPQGPEDSQEPFERDLDAANLKVVHNPVRDSGQIA